MGCQVEQAHGFDTSNLPCPDGSKVSPATTSVVVHDWANWIGLMDAVCLLLSVLSMVPILPCIVLTCVRDVLLYTLEDLLKLPMTLLPLKVIISLVPFVHL